MTEYTYEDIVTAKDLLTGKVKAEDIINKVGWFMDELPFDLSLNLLERACPRKKLFAVDPSEPQPFFFMEDGKKSFTYFLPEKESAPEWMPLDLSKPEDRELLRGKWIRSKVNDHESVATAFKYQEYEWKAHLPQMGLKSGRTLLDDYTFLDGSPIGRKVEERPF